MSASQAGYLNTTGTVHSHGGYARTFTATTYDPYRAQMARQAAAAETGADFAALRAQGVHHLSQLQRTILKNNTIMPGEWVGGTIVLNQPNQGDAGASYTISVGFDGEDHEFTVSQKAQ